MADLESVCRFRLKGYTADFETPENRKDGFVYGIICQEEKTELFLPDLFSVACRILVSAWIFKSGSVYNFEKQYWIEGDNNGKEKIRNG